MEVGLRNISLGKLELQQYLLVLQDEGRFTQSNPTLACKAPAADPLHRAQRLITFVSAMAKHMGVDVVVVVLRADAFTRGLLSNLGNQQTCQKMHSPCTLWTTIVPMLLLKH
eukprot:1328133-Amphidinium_carterae.1